MQKVVSEAHINGYITNLMGRVYRFPDKNLAYKATNYLIQGGCADIVRLAMNKVVERIKEKQCRSRLILQIHDALEFYIHKDEIEMLYEFKNIMESVYQHRYVPLTAAVEISDKSWADTEKIETWLDNPRHCSQIK
jgi:DNA polymerase-1